MSRGAGGARALLARVPAVWLIVVSIASVQFGAAFAKGLFAIVPPTAVVWLRLVFASLILWVVARPRLRGRAGRDWAAVLGYGACLVGMNWAIYQSFARIPIGLAVTLEFLGPLVVVIAGSRRVRDLLWAVLAALGVALLGFVPVDPDWIGIGFALLAGACWAGYILFGKATGRQWEGVSGVTVATSLGAVVMVVPAVLAGGSGVFAPEVLAIGLAVSVLSSVVPYGLEMVALRSIKPNLFGILMSLEPAAAALAALLVLHEWLSPVEWIAMACVVVASIGATRSARDVAPELSGGQ
ncbi:EamA family transporter [Propionicicella superfundia]|uniref:EamA family transporter n=1 Tax=Propionicicella superfundia TaxID=348582 RepID=UPI0003FFAB21|nr:EamA family transporter [Propionicicella superfundia]